MSFIVLRRLKQSELGWFGEIRRQGRETSRQRALNFDATAVGLMFPAAEHVDVIPIDLARRDDQARICSQEQVLRRQAKNWRLTGDRIDDRRFGDVAVDDCFVMTVSYTGGQLRGAFEVLSGAHPIARRLLASPSSAGLVSSGLVALPATSARDVASALRSLDAALFEPFLPTDVAQPGDEPVAAESDPSTPVEHDLPPAPGRMFQVLGNLGHTLQIAMADIIDNSISAGASAIDVRFHQPVLGGTGTIAVVDNGKGMDRPALMEAMKLGSEREYQDRDLGRFGIGLKAASFSQARTLTVASRTATTDPVVLRWDEDHVNRVGRWRVQEPELTPDEQTTLLAPLADHAGTVVMWSKLHPHVFAEPDGRKKSADTTAYGRVLAELEMHLGMVFHRFLEGTTRSGRKVSIRLNGTPVRPWNPFYPTHDDTKELPAFSEVLQRPEADQSATVLVQPFVLPRKDRQTSEEWRRGGFGGRWASMQGLYVYRADRIVQAGGWCGLWGSDPHTTLARVAVSFDPELDRAFAVNAAKMQVKLPVAFAETLEKKLKDVRKEAQDRYRNEGKDGKAKPGSKVVPPPKPPSTPPPTPPKVTTTVPPAPPTSGGEKAPPTSGGGAPPPPVKPPAVGVGPGVENPGPAATVVAPLPSGIEAVSNLDELLWRRHAGMTGQARMLVDTTVPDLGRLVAALGDDEDAKASLARLLAAVEEVLLDRASAHTRIRSRLTGGGAS